MEYRKGSDEAKLLEVWRKYKVFKSQAKIERVGFGLLGVYELGKSERSESDLEHVAGVMGLLMLMSQYFPERVREEYLLDYLLQGMIHEIGETRIGDTPDDGSRDVDAKIAEERIAMEEWTEGMPQSERMLELYDNFNEKLNWWDCDTYMADKVEAILQGLIYELEGKGGLLSNKDRPSARDLEHAELCGSEWLVDVWGTGLKRLCVEHDRHDGLWLKLIDVATLDVRGTPFPYQN